MGLKKSIELIDKMMMDNNNKEDLQTEMIRNKTMSFKDIVKDGN